jgi:outer membrane lipoprotein SlyB
MKMRKEIVLGLFALATFFPLPFAANQAYAQQSAYAVGVPRIDGFDVEPVKQSAPGSELAFTLYGSPGGSAAVQIAGATGGLVLVETEPGVYEGSYTIRKRDKITAASKATANLRLGNRVASTILDEPLIGKVSARRPAAYSAGAPKIDRFDVDAPSRLVAGEELILTMAGSPGGVASARIVGVKGKIVLNEVKPGVYEGSYTIKNRDRIASNSAVTGNLRVDGRETNVALGQQLLATSGAQPRSPARQAAHCVNCGVVEAIHVIEVKGQGSYLGPIAGGVAGALLGSQVGHGTSNTVATLAGAAGGAYAGSLIEKNVKTAKHYEVVVRLENGGTQTFSYAAQPAFAVGSKVKVTNGTLSVI